MPDTISVDLSVDELLTAVPSAIGMSTWTLGLVLKAAAFDAPWLCPLIAMRLMSADEPRKANSPVLLVRPAISASTSRPRFCAIPDPVQAPRLNDASVSVRYNVK